MASLPDDRINLARGALLIAKAAYPDLDESYYLGRLNRMATGLTNQITAKMNSVDTITRINHILFDKEKYHGNRENYYDPDNSFLNRVLDRRTGIPITLSLIYIEVAGRLGLDVRGIGLPGHFITALFHESGKIFIDPFNRGEIRTDDDCRAIILNHLGETGASDPHWLEPIGRKEFRLAVRKRPVRREPAVFASYNLRSERLFFSSVTIRGEDAPAFMSRTPPGTDGNATRATVA